MQWVKGNKTIEVSVKDIIELANKFDSVHVDLGTGDGRYVYELALKNPRILCIGIDPVKSQMREYSVKCVRKKLDNVLFLVSSIENLPANLAGIADKITIILPWGSLLRQVLNPSKETVRKLEKLLKKGGELEIVLGYSVELEPSEAKRLGLPELSEGVVKNVVIAGFACHSEKLKTSEIDSFSKEKLSDIGSNWAKKLAFGKYRQIFLVKFVRVF
ncbi:MAG: hypothetical protein KatS3mg101_0171 [Patescibacteria group bacterium]|nr:MAG: hypothetical protein KatS3mg101_0171 [Patescibacteria group bacterium]